VQEITPTFVIGESYIRLLSWAGTLSHCSSVPMRLFLTEVTATGVLAYDVLTASHIVDMCPLTKFEDGLNLLHEVDDDAVIWLEATATAALAK